MPNPGGRVTVPAGGITRVGIAVAVGRGDAVAVGVADVVALGVGARLGVSVGEGVGLASTVAAGTAVVAAGDVGDRDTGWHPPATMAASKQMHVKI
jgi:hypothetical protein